MRSGRGFGSALVRRTGVHREEARDYARSLGLRSQREWQARAKSGALPADVPTNPDKIYAGKGWQGLGDWLGRVGSLIDCGSSVRFRKREPTRGALA